MLAPLTWLKDYVDIDISAEQLQEKLFSAGFEVEELIELGKDISGVVVGEVLTCELIPDTHISVCTVNCAEKGTFQICCGADNVKVGGRYPVALVGATVYMTAKDHVTIEGVMTIKKGKLRGVESEGMLCSGAELGLNEDLYPGAGYCGLLVLPEDAPIGVDVKPIVGLDEYIFDIGITANRPDCQSIIGIAREVAAILKKPFKMPALDYVQDGKDIDFNITVQTPDLCPRYIGHYVSDVKIAQSPAWLKRRLSLVGINAISNIVDITNYVLKEFGQPMHAFDLANLENSEIIVRCANEKEKITTLDGKEFELNPSNLVICDGNRPVALAGIMGGLNSEINDTTCDVMFEAAKFARDNIRKTSRSLGQSSDSSSRFEKGVDEYSTQLGMKRALHLVCELGCGKVSEFHKDIGSVETILPRPLDVSVSKMNELLGIEVPNDEIVSHLDALGFAPSIDGDILHVMVPPYRDDIDDHVQDIAEEVIRSYGYDHINPRFLNTAQVTCGGRSKEQNDELKLKKALCGQGCYESIFYSFFSPADLDMINLPENAKERNAIRLVNPISEDLSLMRTILAPSMINMVIRNVRRGNTEGRFFEIANTFEPKSLPLEDYPIECKKICIGVFGNDESFFTTKGIVETIAEQFGLSFEYEASEKTYLHPGMTAKIICQSEEIGYIGKLSYGVSEKLSLEIPAFIAELNYDALEEKKNYKLVYKPVSKFSEETRDLSLVMNEDITCAIVTDAIKSSCKYISSVTLFDIYRGAQIGEGKKSMAFKLVFTPEEHELTNEEIEKYIQKLLKKLSFTLNIEIR